MRSHIYTGGRDQGVGELITQLAEDQHALDRYAEIRESYEASKSNAQAFQMGQVTAAVNATRKKSNCSTSNSSHTKCQRCGKFHKKDECKTVWSKCFICNKVSYFAKMCRSKGQSKSSYNQQKKLPLKHRNNTANVHFVTDDG